MIIGIIGFFVALVCFFAVLKIFFIADDVKRIRQTLEAEDEPLGVTSLRFPLLR